MAFRKLLAYAAIYLFWGASFLAIREVVAVAPPFFAAAFRFLCAGALLYGFSLSQGAPRPSRRQWKSTAILGLVMFAGNYGCLFWAEKEVPSGLAAVIAATIPVWVLLVEWLVSRSKLPSPLAFTGIVLGVAGVVLLMLPGGLHNHAFSVSALVLLLGSVLWAGGTVASRRLDLPKHLATSSGLQMSWGGGFLLVLSAITGEWGRLPALSSRWTWHLGFAMAYLILFASIIAFTAYVWLIKQDPVNRVASYAYVNPLVALLLGSWLAHERPTPLQYAGAALVVAGVASTIASRRVAARVPAEKAA